jgi:hypothetical protein
MLIQDKRNRAALPSGPSGPTMPVEVQVLSSALCCIRGCAQWRSPLVMRRARRSFVRNGNLYPGLLLTPHLELGFCSESDIQSKRRELLQSAATRAPTSCKPVQAPGFKSGRSDRSTRRKARFASPGPRLSIRNPESRRESEAQRAPRVSSCQRATTNRCGPSSIAGIEGIRSHRIPHRSPYNDSIRSTQ